MTIEPRRRRCSHREQRLDARSRLGCCRLACRRRLGLVDAVYLIPVTVTRALAAYVRSTERLKRGKTVDFKRAQLLALVEVREIGARTTARRLGIVAVRVGRRTARE